MKATTTDPGYMSQEEAAALDTAWNHYQDLLALYRLLLEKEVCPARQKQLLALANGVHEDFK